MSRAWPLLLAALLASACGGAVQDGAAQNGAAEDEVLTRLAGSATRALELDQPQSAAQLYARALARARERDDAARMDDMAFGQATAALAQGDAGAALAVTQEVRTELSRRGRAASPRLLLAEATALQRLGRAAAADLLLRAGQGAATRGEVADARAWLAEAARLASAAGRPALAAEARRAGAGLRPGP